MSGSITSANRVEPNLTPILDMVFQLITFFVLVLNFKSAEIDLSLRLPVVGSARPIETHTSDLLVLNVDKEGSLKVYNTAVKDVESYIKNEAQASRLAARRINPKLKEDDELPTMVVVRADKTIPFKLLNNVFTSCQKYGFRSFSLKALNRQEEP
jgi:biopolymer transport protein ExbD